MIVSMHDRKIINQHVHEVVTQDGAERIVRDCTIRVPQEPQFYKVYTHSVADLNQLKNPKKDVLNIMAAKMDYDNVVRLTTGERKRWAQHLKITMGTLNNAISYLVNNGYAERRAAGEYVVNPFMFSKGDWAATMDKRHSFTAYFAVRFEAGVDGFTKSFRHAFIRPDGCQFDPETGEAIES